MSDSNVLISQHDLPLLKDFVKFTLDNSNVNVSLHDGYNLLAKAIGYRNWNCLSKSNKHEVLFSDVFQVLNESAPAFFKEIANHTSTTLTEEQAISARDRAFASFIPSNRKWLELSGVGRSAYNNEMKICLLPTEKPACFILLGYKSYLELLIRAKHINENPDLFAMQIIEIDLKKTRRRVRPHKTSLPIYSYLDSYIKNAVFVEKSNIIVTHYNSIKSEDVVISDISMQYLCARSAFFYPISYCYTLEVKNSSLLLYSNNEFDNRVIGIDFKPKKALEQFKENRPNGEYIPIELLLCINQLKDSPVSYGEECYLEFCNKYICAYYNLSYIAKP
ncbi:MAG: hypothetical protein LAT53_05330 [Idiomarina sp.]|nr:hypothetical protein [Idiomarina sp.]